VIKAEGKVVDNEVICVIADNADGNARTALNRLETVIDMDTEKALAYLSTLGFMEEATPEVIELVRELFTTSTMWTKIYPMLISFKGLNMEETIRNTVCGYAMSMMKSGYNARAVKVLHFFSEPFFSTGYVGMFTAFARVYS
jgi:hypothetical protein